MSLQRRVVVHVTFLKVGEINTLKECFEADVLLRTKWRLPELDKVDGRVLVSCNTNHFQFLTPLNFYTGPASPQPPKKEKVK